MQGRQVLSPIIGCLQYGNGCVLTACSIPGLECEREPIMCLLHYFYLAALTPGSQGAFQAASSAASQPFQGSREPKF